MGIVACVMSFIVDDIAVSALLGVLGFSSFLMIGEIFEQKKRVEKGWFPANPKRKKG